MATIAGLAAKQATDRAALIAQLIQLLLGLWRGFDRWDDVDVVNGMAARSATLVDTATQRSRLLTRSFQMAVLRQSGAGRVKLPPIVNAYPRANVSGSDAYHRPVEQFIWARRNGLPFADSQAAFETRLRDLATQDVKLADRDEAHQVLLRDPEVDRWRRVIHPELSASGTCGLCIVASQRVYSTDELMPMHGPSCNCTVMGITRGHDPGLKLNDDDLKAIYAAAGSTAAEDLQNTRISINEHGELGPVLVKQGDNFKSAADAGRPAYVKQTKAVIRAAREAERTLLQQQTRDAQANYDAAIAAGVDPSDIVPLFRSIKYLRERVQGIDRFLSTLTD